MSKEKPEVTLEPKNKVQRKPLTEVQRFMAATGQPKIAAKAILQKASHQLVKAFKDAEKPTAINKAAAGILDAYYGDNKATSDTVETLETK